MNTRTPLPEETTKLLLLDEDHFTDLKSKLILPAKLQETYVAFANADGGDIWIGIEDKKTLGERINGFKSKEEANPILQTLLEQTAPTVENTEVEFIDFGEKGHVLHLSIPKSTKVHYCTNGDCFLRINASKTKIKGDRITQLGYAKGSLVYEKQIVESAEAQDYIESEILKKYLGRIGSSLTPENFLRKQKLLIKKNNNQKVTVAGVLMFDEEPQATLDTRCAIKVYRLLTSEAEYKREQLKGTPKTISGPIESQIHSTIEEVTNLLKNSSITIDGNLQKINYPSRAIHEILVNSIVHRDYSLNDDIHVKIYDNRIEVLSPGKLPGYITPDNIYDERFSRNPTLVRLLHNLPNPVNHDIGEGLDTVRNEMKKAGLVDPIIEELGNAVRITIKHKKLASIEDIIMEYLIADPERTITNKQVRDISGEDDVNKVKKAFQKLRKLEKIEPVNEDATAFDFAYKLRKQ
jgi:ATP-dependent DNA helicase RecG